MIFHGRAPELAQAARPILRPNRLHWARLHRQRKSTRRKTPADVGKDNKNKTGKESASSKPRRSINADLDGAPVPPASVGSR
jgi:hypothetical protein